MKYILLFLLIFIVLIPLAMIIFPKINYRPAPHGLCEGKLNQNKPNWVSSLVAESNEHYIEPLQFASLSSLADCIKNFIDTQITHLSDTHLLAYHQSKTFHFTDWLCVKADGHVSSSATMGHYDFNKNREWVNKIRESCKP